VVELNKASSSWLLKYAAEHHSGVLHDDAASVLGATTSAHWVHSRRRLATAPATIRVRVRVRVGGGGSRQLLPPSHRLERS